MHAIFTKNQSSKKDSVVDDFINRKHEEYKIEEKRNNKALSINEANLINHLCRVV